MDADRRRRLIALFEGKRFNKDTQQLIKESGYSKGRVSQFFDKTQAFGERSARNLALRLELPPRFFEEDDEAGIRDFDVDTLVHAAQYQRLGPDERATLRLLYQVARAGVHPDKIKSALTGQDASEPNDLMLGGESGLMGLGDDEEAGGEK